MAVKETRRIIIRATGKDLKVLRDAAKGLGKIERSTRRTSQVLSQFRTAFAAIASAQVVRNIARISDEFQLAFDRIRAFEGQEQATQVFTNLADIANETRTSVSALGDSYARLRLSTADLNLSSEATLGLTAALQQSFRLAGSTIAEARGATVQLAQGLAAGALRGQELRSVLEANAIAGSILAKEFGITRGELIKFGETGQITADRVLKAFADNAEDLQKRASTLNTTIEQGLTIGINELGVAVQKLNERIQIGSKISQSINFLIDNFREISTVVGGLVGAALFVKLASGIGALAGALTTLGTTLFAIISGATTLGAVFGTVTASALALPAIIGAIGAGLAVLAVNFDTVAPKANLFIEQLSIGFNTLKIEFLEFVRSIGESAGLGNTGLFFNLKQSIDESSNSIEKSKLNINSLLNQIEQASRQADNGSFSINNFYKSLGEGASTVETNVSQTGKLDQQLRALNNRYLEGNVSAQQYADALRKIEVEQASDRFSQGQINLEQYNKALEQTINPLVLLNEQFRSGTITLSQYIQKQNELEFERVKRGFEQGTVSIREFNQASLAATETFNPQGSILTGVSQYIESAGTLSQNVAGFVNNTFQNLEDSLVEFVQTGKFQFRDFTKAILEDLNRIIIRQFIVRQLAQGITGAFSGGSQPQTDINSGAFAGNADRVAAKGLSFNGQGQVQAFSQGGIVDRPTLFGFGNRQTGLMGEAGPEAIVPLKRGSNGDLGIQAAPSNVNINIINNVQNTEVESREIEDSFGNKSIEVVINSTVKNGIASGQFDKTFRSNFGLQRRGN